MAGGGDAEMAGEVVLEDLQDELLLEIAAKLPAASLLAFQATCRRARRLPTQPLWRALCAARWASRARFALTPAREKWLAVNMPLSWRDRYAYFEHDARRNRLSVHELLTLRWFFNFRGVAGGSGAYTRAEARFVNASEAPWATSGECVLEVPNYPPLTAFLVEAEEADMADDPPPPVSTWPSPLSQVQTTLRNLVNSVTERPAAPRTQQMVVSDFPSHTVERLPNEWEWLIYNSNVMIASCAHGAEPHFDDATRAEHPALRGEEF